MNTDFEKQMAIMVDAVQPYCDEQIVAAMICSHAGSMRSTLFAKFLGGAGAPGRSFNLPNPVFIAVGTDTIYAFDFKPRGFKFKIKKEAARWPRKAVRVTIEKTGTMTTFALSLDTGENFALEVSTILGGSELVNRFIEAIRR